MNISTLRFCQNEFLTTSNSTKYLLQQFRRLNTVKNISIQTLGRPRCGLLRPLNVKNGSITKNTFCGSQLLHTTSHVHGQNDNNKQVKVNTTVVNLQNPFKFIALKIKLFLLKSYFDKSFTEDDFIKGAKQVGGFIFTNRRRV